MNRARLVIATLVVVAFLFVMNGSVVAASHLQQYYGGAGGQISGYVIGNNKQPVDWAAIYAKSTNRTFEAFSGMSGFYEMRLPAATYNLTINVPGYEALVTNATVIEGSSTNMNFNLNSMDVTVSAGSSSVINFYLQQNQTPVPEFQPTVTLLVAVLALASTLVLKRLKQ